MTMTHLFSELTLLGAADEPAKVPGNAIIRLAVYTVLLIGAVVVPLVVARRRSKATFTVVDHSPVPPPKSRDGIADDAAVDPVDGFVTARPRPASRPRGFLDDLAPLPLPRSRAAGDDSDDDWSIAGINPVARPDADPPTSLG